jgi:hypothetical protein
VVLFLTLTTYSRSLKIIQDDKEFIRRKAHPPIGILPYRLQRKNTKPKKRRDQAHALSYTPRCNNGPEIERLGRQTPVLRPA